MNDNAKKLVEALRSGEFKQGVGVLRRHDKYCCLGVACELYQCEHPETSRWLLNVSIPDIFYVDYAGVGFYKPKCYYDTGLLPDPVRAWFGFNTVDGEFNDENLVDHNDSGASFNEIADIIESEPEGLFV